MLTTLLATTFLLTTQVTSHERLPADVIPVMKLDLVDYATLFEDDVAT